MKVLHAAAEIGGQAATLCRALRERGIDATSLAYNTQPAKYPVDELRHYDDAPILPRLWGYAKTAARFLGRYDLVHVHFGRSLLPPWNLDLPLHHVLGTKLVFHFHGCDVRNRALMLERHSGEAACTECDPFCSPPRQRQVIAQAARHGDAIFVSTPDLLESVPGSEHLPVALDVSRWRDVPIPKRSGNEVRVLHIPTNRLIKGTAWIERGVARAQAAEPRIDWVLRERVPWTEVRSVMLDADIIVDQVYLGWYGIVAVEAMALGKAVVGFLRPDFEPLAQGLGLPLVRADRNTVGDAVLELARDPGRRAELGARGVDYALRVHDAGVLADRLVERYKAILGGAGAMRR